MDAALKKSDTQLTVAERTRIDTNLLKRISRGDHDAFSELYTNYQPRLIKFCSRILKNDIALAADIVDEAMIEIWRSAGSFSGRSQPSTWIHSIARFRLIGYLRKNKELQQDESSEWLNYEDDALLPDEEIALSERNEQIIKNIGKLSDKHREVIELVYFRELSIKEIALMLDISENTVKTRMFYARNHLKNIFSSLNI
ncbi:MAG TPA: sigma-70 family RNA polymerase sigma factor [Leucothrix sp.]|nr:sigma-70 family RNA polymerase sigma factor [Leucothrix sp.]